MMKFLLVNNQQNTIRPTKDKENRIVVRVTFYRPDNTRADDQESGARLDRTKPHTTTKNAGNAKSVAALMPSPANATGNDA
jgi:hypothetical protein